MKARLVVAVLAAVHGPSVPGRAPTAQTPSSAARETHIRAGAASLYSRDIGRGQPVVVLHGGPDFDHRYLLPDMDRLAGAFRLIYYDQRGRGGSAEGVRAEDVTLASDLDDLDTVRRHYRLESPALLGHSWGAILALEYAVRHPARVSHLILMNPAPVSARHLVVLRKAYLQQLGADMDRQREILASAAYKEGDPDAVAARYRVHFKFALKQPQHFEKLMATMKAAFVAQGREGIVKARAVEDRLMRDTWESKGYDLVPRLGALNIPTLVIYGDHDFIPADISVDIARAIRGARLVTLANCGHFAYLECPGDLRQAFDDFFRRRTAGGGPRRARRLAPAGPSIPDDR